MNYQNKLTAVRERKKTAMTTIYLLIKETPANITEAHKKRT